MEFGELAVCEQSFEKVGEKQLQRMNYAILSAEYIQEKIFVVVYVIAMNTERCVAYIIAPVALSFLEIPNYFL